MEYSEFIMEDAIEENDTGVQHHEAVDNEGRISVMRLRVPLAIALGLYEQLTDEQLDDHYHDICAERERRKEQNK